MSRHALEATGLRFASAIQKLPPWQKAVANNDSAAYIVGVSQRSRDSSKSSRLECVTTHRIPKIELLLIPPYLRRSKLIEELFKLLYLRGISTVGFAEAMTPLPGEEAKGLSANAVVRPQTKMVLGV